MKKFLPILAGLSLAISSVLGQPLPPVLIAPDSGSTVYKSEVIFRWHKVVGAVKYELRLDKLSTEFLDTTYKITVSRGIHHWWVRACDAQGRWLDNSGIWSFIYRDTIAEKIEAIQHCIFGIRECSKIMDKIGDALMAKTADEVLIMKYTKADIDTLRVKLYPVARKIKIFADSLQDILRP